MTPARRLCLTVHAERLHEDPVWQAVRRLLALLERRGGRGTFLVSPLRASVAGIDLGPRLRELEDRGHEVGQHTHYYALAAAPAGRVRFDKRTDASPANLRRCLDHDHARLVAAGLRPRGFVAGAWEIHEPAHDWLVEHGFAYDLSYRSFPLGYANPAAAPGSHRTAPFQRRGLLEIPTTAPLARALRHEILGRPRLPYEVWYVHDYDLPNLRHRAALLGLDHLLGNTLPTTACELAALLGANLEPAPPTAAIAVRH